MDQSTNRHLIAMIRLFHFVVISNKYTTLHILDGTLLVNPGFSVTIEAEVSVESGGSLEFRSKHTVNTPIHVASGESVVISNNGSVITRDRNFVSHKAQDKKVPYFPV